jgi:transglutaminase-like putative cysteine protease
MEESTAPDGAYLRPGRFIDSDHPAVAAFARRVAGDEIAPRAVAVRLYNAVRDDILYDPYRPYRDLDTYRASTVLAR